MPELPDVDVYIEHIARKAGGHAVERVRLASPFVLRTATPPISEATGGVVERVFRVGKRIVLALSGRPTPLFLVIHLMVAGRFKWKPRGAPIPGKVGLFAIDFADPDGGSLILTEVSSKKRASLHLVDRAGLDALDPGGLEVMNASVATFAAKLRSENHTLKRAMTDPHLLAGIGNAYSDEILHHAQMSPVKLTSRLTDDEMKRLLASTHRVLSEWTDRLRAESGDFPEKVTAFRPEMAVHGKYGQPCPRCQTKVQRIRYADNESNYCPRCQTDGKLLADRSLSRLMKGDWPKTLEELEAKKVAAKSGAPKATAAKATAAKATAAKATAAKRPRPKKATAAPS